MCRSSGTEVSDPNAMDARTGGKVGRTRVWGHSALDFSETVHEMFASVRELIREQISETQTPEMMCCVSCAGPRVRK